MVVKVFSSELQPDSESAYRQWLSDNPDGYVINALKTASGKASKSDERLPGFIRLIVKASTHYLHLRKRKASQLVDTRSFAQLPLNWLREKQDLLLG